jgi:hypothetical protein
MECLSDGLESDDDEPTPHVVINYYPDHFEFCEIYNAKESIGPRPQPMAVSIPAAFALGT